MNRFLSDIIREYPSFIRHLFIIAGIVAAWVLLCGIVRFLIGHARSSH